MLEPRKSPAVWASSYESDNAHVAVRCRIHGHGVRRPSATDDSAILCDVQAAEVSQVPVGSGRTSFITFLSIVDLRPPNHSNNSNHSNITFVLDRVIWCFDPYGPLFRTSWHAHLLFLAQVAVVMCHAKAGTRCSSRSCHQNVALDTPHHAICSSEFCSNTPVRVAQ